MFSLLAPRAAPRGQPWAPCARPASCSRGRMRSSRCRARTRSRAPPRPPPRRCAREPRALRGRRRAARAPRRPWAARCTPIPPTGIACGLTRVAAWPRWSARADSDAALSIANRRASNRLSPPHAPSRDQRRAALDSRGRRAAPRPPARCACGACEGACGGDWRLPLALGCAARWAPAFPRTNLSSQNSGTRFKVVAPVVGRLWRCDRWVVSRTGTKSLDSARLAAKASHQAGWRACLLAGGHQSFGGGVARALPCRRATRPAAGGCGGADPAAHAAGSAMGRPSSLCDGSSARRGARSAGSMSRRCGSARTYLRVSLHFPRGSIWSCVWPIGNGVGPRPKA